MPNSEQLLILKSRFELYRDEDAKRLAAELRAIQNMLASKGKLGSGDLLCQSRDALIEVLDARRRKFLELMDEVGLVWHRTLDKEILKVLELDCLSDLDELNAQLEGSLQLANNERAAAQIRNELEQHIDRVRADMMLSVSSKVASLQSRMPPWYTRPLGILILGLIVTILGGLFLAAYA